jgi:3-deoxy-manno-octulosonate cytidylyltransferase (CMP-KDO synthetase)
MSAIVIIPSRYHSARFPGKPLTLISNKPMIQHVYERSRAASLIKEVFVATDSQRIFDAVRHFGGNAIMTSAKHISGTDRIAEAADIIRNGGCEAEIIVNVQGDEPMIRPDMIDLVTGIMADMRADIGTLVKRIDDPGEINDPNVVKAVFNDEGFALYFSRAPLPFHRDLFSTEVKKHGKADFTDMQTSELYMFKHIGIYAYRADILKRFSELPASRLEEIEKLEQLRALANGISIKIQETNYETIGVDTPMDLERVRKCLNTSL